MSSPAPQSLPLLRKSTIAWAIGATAAGVVLIALGVLLAGVWGLVLAAIGTAAMSLGIVNFAAEYNLKRLVAHDIVQLIQLKERLFASGIDEIDRDDRFPWANLLEPATEIFVASTNPQRWMDQLWQRSLDRAKASATIVEIYLIDPNSPEVITVASRLRMKSQEYTSTVTAVTEKLWQEWEQQKRQGHLNSKSRLSISHINVDPGHSLVETNAHFALLLDPIHAGATESKSMCFAFRKSDFGEAKASWLTDAMSTIRSSAPTPVHTDARIADDDSRLEI